MQYRTTVRYVVTDANVAPHHFQAGTPVRFVQAARPSPKGAEPDRFLFRGKSAKGESIVQWLAAEDVALAPDSSARCTDPDCTHGFTKSCQLG